MSNEELFKKLAEDTGETSDLVSADYEKIKESVRKDERYTNLKEEEVEQIARNKLLVRKRREMNSPAQTWEGVVLAKFDLIDGVKKARALSVEAYTKDPIQAQNEKGWMYKGKLVRVKVGTLNEKGQVVEGDDVIPVYPKTESNDKWHRSGLPLPPNSWMRTIFGIAAPIDKKTRKVGEAKCFTMTLNDKKALDAKSIPMNTPIRFKGTDKTTEEARKNNEYVVGSSAYSIFEPAPDLKLPPIEDLITTVAASKVEVLGQIEEYHLKNSEVFNRLVIVEGTVSLLNPEPNKNGSMFLSLDDESLLFTPTEDGKTPTVACYIPTDRGIIIDFTQDSRVFVIGRTGQSYKKDEQGNKTEELGQVNINVYGIYCPEMFKVVQEQVELPPDALDAVEEDEEPSEW